ncbi:MAG: hypothetical protein KBS67_00540, partial [Bacteroidales bacterium]|nr:hypothetical protein [Candidatus Cryptobacteroides equifaecalis]
IIHNIKYAGDVMFSWGGIGMIIIPALIVVTTLLLARRDERLKDLSFMLVPMLVFTVILIGKRDYYHYLIPLIPYMLLCYTLCLMHSQKVFLWVVCSLLVAFSYRECSFVVNTWLRSSVTREFYAQTDELFRQVPEDERNTVWNYNLDTYKGDRKPHVISQMGAFLHAGLTPSCPVLAAYDIHTMDESYSLRARRPKWVVMTEASYYMEDVEFIYENYELVAQTPQEPVCSVRLYRLK